jgi:hypothetical protein
MNEFQLALLVGAAFVALICLVARQPRGLLWIMAGLLSFVVSTWYGRQDMPYPSAITAFCDVLMCFAVYFMARERWEKYIFYLFQASVLTSLLFFVGVIGPHWAYISFLEAINWLALGVIGGTAALSWVQNARGNHYWLVGHLRGARRLVWAPRSPPQRGR